MLIPKFTEEFRLRELERGRRSLFYFGVAILGFTANDPDGEPQVSRVHQELCEFLEGRPPNLPWRRAMVCGHRGVAKSVWTTQTYPLWRGLYIVNFSTKIIENSADNAKRHHFLPLVELLTTSNRADYLQWLYHHRIPPGFAGTNAEQLKLVQTDPLANPCLSYWGIDSKFEGAHPDLVVLDDPEGSDANKSLAANEEAWTAYQSCIPLLKHPLRSQILVVLTPHGENPMAWRIRDRERWSGPADNTTSEFKIWWRPVLDADNTPAWPERFPLDYILALSREEIFDQQYMLRRKRSTISLFKMEVIYGDGSDENPGSCYSLVPGRPAAIYPGFDYDPSKLATDPDYRLPEPKPRIALLSELRTYLHFDPLHRELAARRSSVRKQRPAEAAIVAVGVTRDYHVLVLDTWSANANVDEQVSMLFHLYCKWAPALVTFESIAAQAWLPSLVRSFERTYEHWRRPVSSSSVGTAIDLPAMSSRMVEDDKTNESKEAIYRDVLSSWINRGALHLRRDQNQLIHQLENALNLNEAVDLVDCLGQGPRVWSPPISSDTHSRKYQEHVNRVNAKLARAANSTAGWMQRTQYRRPWQGTGTARRPPRGGYSS